MRAILKINYQEYVLPAKTNVQSLLEALANSIPVEKKYTNDRGDFYVRDEDLRQLLVEMVPDGIISQLDRKQIPAKASPDCHGDVSKRD